MADIADGGSIEKKDPIKDFEAPLRYPGQSLDEAIDDYFYAEVITWFILAAAGGGVTLFAWCQRLFRVPVDPVLITVLTIAVCVIAIVRLRSKRAVLKAMRLGSRGEKVVGQFLEGLRQQGYKVLHDIPGDRFNVDHVVVGPAGVFAIETKTLRKPAKGNPEITYDGTRIQVPGIKLDRDPVVQARASANHVKDVIKQHTGKTVAVRGVVLFWGWLVARQPKGVEVWVLNPKALPSFLEQEDSLLTADDVNVLAGALAMHVRNYNRVESPVKTSGSS